MHHGDFVDNISDKLSKKIVVIYILLSFYRRGLTAVSILVLYNYPVAQVILCVLLTLGYLVYVINFEVFKAR